MKVDPPKRKRSKSSGTDVAKPVPAKLSRKEHDAAAEAAQRTLARREPIAVKLDQNGQLAKPEDMEARTAQFLRLSDTFGTASGSFMATAIGALRHSAYGRGADGTNQVVLNASIALVDAIRPENELEAALAVQMANCHQLANEMLGRAATTDRTDHLQLYGNMAVKLQRTFTEQLEALGRMRGNANQSVRVEHVHVHEGGQAIVGNVKANRGEGKREGEDQSHAA